MVLTSDIREELSKGKYYARGRDKEGHIIIWVQVEKMPRGAYKSVDVAIDSMLVFRAFLSKHFQCRCVFLIRVCLSVSLNIYLYIYIYIYINVLYYLSPCKCILFHQHIRLYI
jgi:hypothetical protein